MMIECKRCGVLFERGNTSQRYCEDCKIPAHKEAQARWYRERHPMYGPARAITKQAVGPSITDLNRAARSHWMTYGRYILNYGV